MLSLLVGAAVLRISLFSDLYPRYVQAGLRPYLVPMPDAATVRRLAEPSDPYEKR